MVTISNHQIKKKNPISQSKARQKFVVFEFLYKIYWSEMTGILMLMPNKKTFSITTLFKFNESKAWRSLSYPNFTNLSKTLKCSFKLKGNFVYF